MVWKNNFFSFFSILELNYSSNMYSIILATRIFRLKTDIIYKTAYKIKKLAAVLPTFIRPEKIVNNLYFNIGETQYPIRSIEFHVIKKARDMSFAI